MGALSERHPFDPFLPENARILFLGSFPPQMKRWSMPFYYPNWNNDFWRVMGLLFFGDRDHFAIPDQKRFDQARVEAFCREKGLALYDTACEVRRLKDNASDKFLEVVTPTDLPALLARIPACRTLVTTGQKATDVIVETFGCVEPPVGESVEIEIGEPPTAAETAEAAGGEAETAGGASGAIAVATLTKGAAAGRTLTFWRMPSTSRAYPLALERKADFYRRLWTRGTSR